MILVYTVKSGKSTDSDRSNENIQYSDHKKKKNQTSLNDIVYSTKKLHKT
jgi:hypothetical protein